MKKLLLLAVSLLLINTSTFADMHMYEQHTSQASALTDGKLHLYFCGTGDPEIAMQSIRKPFCLAVIADKQFFTIDSGEGTSQNLGALGLPLGSLDKVFATHWHSDHMAGIGYLNNISWLSGRKGPLTLYGPYGVKTIASALNKLYSLDTLFRGTNRQGLLDVNKALIKPKLISVPDTGVGKPVLKTNALSLSPFRVNHEPVYPAVGYVIQYKACKVVISGDTNVMKNLAATAKNADVLINEAFSNNLGNMIKQNIETQTDPKIGLEYFKQTAHYHSNTLDIAKMAEEANVKQVILTHLVPAIPTTQSAKEAFIKGMSDSYKGPITVVDDRDELILSSEGGKCTVQYKPAPQYDIKVIQTMGSS